MKLILVPHSSTKNDANIWMCATDTALPPADFKLTIEKMRDETVQQADWAPVEVGSLKAADTQTYVQVKNIKNLQPHTQYHAVAGPARASFSTLPADVPREGERPLTVLLGSCFYAGNGLAPLIGVAIDGLPPELKPDVKILCGDQLYLDVPEVTFLPLADNALSSLLLSKYLRNWNDESSYQILLKNGASYFTADDHEFWNNHPNRAIHIPNTWTQDGRDRFEKRALQLFQAFQCENKSKAGRNQGFEVGRLSFRVADTRVYRKPGDDEFMQPGDLQEIVDWVHGLEGPRVLVLGQPIFAEPGGFLRRTFVDRVLPDYKQYAELVTAISKAKSSVVILTGDVHYSRIATAVFRLGVRAPEVTEIIASPTAVVAGAPGKPTRPPDRFPQTSINGVTSATTTTRLSGSSDNNFATLQFTQTSGQINMRVQHFYIRNRAAGSLSIMPGSAIPQPGEVVNIPLF